MITIRIATVEDAESIQKIYAPYVPVSYTHLTLPTT